MKKTVSLILTMLLFVGCICQTVMVASAEEQVTEAEAVGTGVDVWEEGGLWGLSLPNATNPFFAKAIAGVEDAIAELDPTAKMVLMDSNADAVVQNDQIADLINQGVKCVIAAAVDSNAIGPAIKEAKAAGIPFIIIDTGASEKDGLICTVVSNNYSAGEIAGEALCEALEGEGKIMVISTPGSSAVAERRQALYDMMEEKYPGIELVTEQMSQEGTTEDALTIAENLLQSVPDVDGFFTTGDVMALGIVAALKANGYGPGDVKVTSVDGTNDACAQIKEGYITATAAQLPDQMGYYAVVNGIEYLKGNPVQEEVFLDCQKVDESNVDTYKGF